MSLREKMVAIHPNILEHDGQKAFVVLPYEEFLLLRPTAIKLLKLAQKNE
jgi:hypothetical protein